MAEEILAILGGIMKLATTAGGLGALSQFFADHNITQDHLDQVYQKLSTPSVPKVN